MTEGRSFVELLREKSRRGEGEVAERLRTARDETTVPSLKRAREFVEEEVLPAVETAATGGNWYVARSLARPGTELNEKVLVAEIQRLLIRERGVRADVTMTPEHITVYVSWLPPLALMPLVGGLKEGERGAVFACDLRCVGDGDSRPKEVWIRKDAEVYFGELLPADFTSRVLVRRDAQKGLVVGVYGVVDVLVHDGQIDARSFVRVTWGVNKDTGGQLRVHDGRSMMRAIYEAATRNA